MAPSPIKKPAEDDAAAAPHYTGHRDRLRERFRAAPDSLPDYELLELLLFMVIPRRDVKPLAKSLIARFGSIRGVLTADLAALEATDGLSETSALALKTVQAAGVRLMKQELIGKTVLNSWQKLLDYLHATMAHEGREHFRLLFLNKKNELIADEVQQTGTVDHTPAYPREIVKRALERSATAVILVHNHPSGDATPSRADIDMTRDIIAAATPMGIVIHDHLIVGRTGVTSMKSIGVI